MTTILALTGSPRRHGNSAIILEELITGARSIGADTYLLNLNDLLVRPCSHCDGCLTTGHCVVIDDMSNIYQQILQCDALVLASPIYFSALCAQTKLMIDRCQPFWVSKYILKQNLFPYSRPGVFLSTGGQPSYGSQFSGALNTVNLLFKMIGVNKIGEILLSNTDANPAANQSDIRRSAYELGCNLAQNALSAKQS